MQVGRYTQLVIVKIEDPDSENQWEDEESYWTKFKRWFVSILKTVIRKIRLTWVAVILCSIWLTVSSFDRNVTTSISTVRLGKHTSSVVMKDELTSVYMLDYCFCNEDIFIVFLGVIHWLFLGHLILRLLDLDTNPAITLFLLSAVMIVILTLIYLLYYDDPLLHSFTWKSSFIVIQICLYFLWASIQILDRIS